MSAPINLYRLQNFCAHALLCTDRLNNVNIVTHGELLTPESLKRLPDQTLAAEVLAYITERNGRFGAGIIIFPPEITGRWPDAPGQSGDVEVEFLVLEEELSNSDPDKGTLLHADEIGQVIIDVCKHWVVDGYGIFVPPQNCWKRDDNWAPLRALRVRLKTTAPLGQSNRVSFVTVTVANGDATLASATTGADIYFTLDETFPGPSNSRAQKYAGAFPVVSGDIVLAAAYDPGSALTLSRITRSTIP